MQFDLISGRPNYGAIHADPPWRFETISDKGRGRCPDGRLPIDDVPLLEPRPPSVAAAKHYETMPTDEICAMDFGQHESPHCVLYLWGTFAMIEDAMRVGKAWGFRYVSARVWVKTRVSGFDPILTLDQNFPMGTGYVTRGNPEPLLIFTRGRPEFRAPPRALIIAPRREHSRKPDVVWRDIERQVPGPYLEVFARQRRPGWDAIGNQLDKFEPIAGAAA